LRPTANGEGSTIVYGDINTRDRTVIAPPTVSQGPAAPAPAPAPAPVDDSASAAPADTSTDATGSTGTVATEGDLDGDNYPDAAVPDLGLDPTNPDTDSDGVADGDELTIYGTDPTNGDTDGDGIADGEELFGIHTDPLVWNDASADTTSPDVVSEQRAAPAPSTTAPAPVVQRAQDSSEILTATDGNASALGPGNASAAPGTVTRPPGTTLLGPDGTYNVSDTTPPVITVGATSPAPPPVSEAPVVEETAAPVDAATTDETVASNVPADTSPAAATETDADGDNYPDAAEYDLGLDPSNADTDGDGVADGDEITIYGTDPTAFDTDGDGVGDGEELFGIQTDPLAYDTDGDGLADGHAATA
jgi:hypothetical protein